MVRLHCDLGSQLGMGKNTWATLSHSSCCSVTTSHQALTDDAFSPQGLFNAGVQMLLSTMLHTKTPAGTTSLYVPSSQGGFVPHRHQNRRWEPFCTNAESFRLKNGHAIPPVSAEIAPASKQPRPSARPHGGPPAHRIISSDLIYLMTGVVQ